MRVFVPATSAILADLHASGKLDAGPDAVGYAVTPALREWYSYGDSEELEYAALTEAARASLRLLAAEREASPRRVVIAVDLTQAVPDATLGPAAVRFAEPVTLDLVASLHIDDADAEETVRSAVAALEPARRGDTEAALAVEEPEGFELLWFATQELGDLVG